MYSDAIAYTFIDDCKIKIKLIVECPFENVLFDIEQKLKSALTLAIVLLL
jgi:hypothetical protein